MMADLFQKALGINDPWQVKSIDFDVEAKRLDVHVDFKRGATFIDNEEDEELRKPYKAYEVLTVIRIAYALNNRYANNTITEDELTKVDEQHPF